MGMSTDAEAIKKDYREVMSKARYEKEAYLTKVMVNSSAIGIILLLIFTGLNDIANIIPMKVAISLLFIGLFTSIMGVFCSAESHESVIRELAIYKEVRKDVHNNYWTNKASFLYSLSVGLVLGGLTFGFMFILVNL